MSMDMPPSKFVNTMNDINPKFDFRNWRRSKEWKIFMAGYNDAVTTACGEIALLRDLGTTPHKLYGEDQAQESKANTSRPKAVSGAKTKR